MCVRMHVCVCESMCVGMCIGVCECLRAHMACAHVTACMARPSGPGSGPWGGEARHPQAPPGASPPSPASALTLAGGEQQLGLGPHHVQHDGRALAEQQALDPKLVAGAAEQALRLKGPPSTCLGPAGSSQLGAAGVSRPGLVQHAHSRARPQMGSGRTGPAQQGCFGQAPRCQGQGQSPSVGHSPPRAEGSPRRAQAGLREAMEPCPPPTPTTSLAWRKAWTPQGSSEGPEAEGCTSGVCPHPSRNPFSLLQVRAQLPLSTPAHPQGCRLTRGCPAGGGRTGRRWRAWPGPPRRSAGSRSAGGVHVWSLQPLTGAALRGGAQTHVSPLLTHLVLLREELEQLLEDLHVELGAVPRPDHGGDLLVGAGGARVWRWPRTARATALGLLGPCPPGTALGPQRHAGHSRLSPST